MGLNAPNLWIQRSWADIICTLYPQEYSEIQKELGRRMQQEDYS